MKKKKIGLLPRLLIGIAAGLIVGSAGNWLGAGQSPVFIGVIRVLTTFKNLFATFLNFLIPLLIVSFVAVGLADLGKKANKLFGITLLLAYASTLLAGFLSYLAGAAILPGLIAPIEALAIEGAGFEALFTISVDPVFSVMTALVLAFLLGLGMANSKSTTLLEVTRGLQEIIAKALTHVIIPLIPVYIASMFALIAAEGRLFATIRMLLTLFVLILVFQWLYLALQFLIATLFCKENKYKKLRDILPAYLTALGTQSSAATIPVSLEAAKKIGTKEDVADFCIPLCATIHLAGDTICLVLGTMGIMLASGLTPSLTMFAPFIFMLGVTMVAAPGVPGGGVMAALGLIGSMLGFTDPMQQLIISLHFSQDSFGTATNITGDQALAMIVDKIDQEK